MSYIMDELSDEDQKLAKAGLCIECGAPTKVDDGRIHCDHCGADYEIKYANKTSTKIVLACVGCNAPLSKNENEITVTVPDEATEFYCGDKACKQQSKVFVYGSIDIIASS